jgi:UDPglucose 6-dehydrogenase
MRRALSRAIDRGARNPVTLNALLNAVDDIAIIGTGYVGLTTGRLLRPPRPRRRLRRHRRGEGRAAQRGEIPILEAGSTSSCARASRPGGCGSCSAPPRRADCEFAYLCVPTPRATTARPTCPTSRPRPARSPGAARSPSWSTSRPCRSGSTRVVERALGAATSRGVEPRVPPRGLGGPRLPEPRPGRHRRRRPGRRHRVASLYLGVTGPAHGHRPGLGRDHQVRGQRLPGHQDLVRQRRRRVCEAVGADVNDVVLGMGYDKRIGHEFLKPGTRLGRLVLPEGHAGDGHIAEEAATTSTCSGVIEVNDEQFDRTAEKVERAGRRRRRRQAGRGVGPHVQGPHRRPARVAVARGLGRLRPPGPRSGPTTRR